MASNATGTGDAVVNIADASTSDCVNNILHAIGDSTAEFDFRLPHINTTGVSDKSTTNEPLINGLMENVVFEKWTGFDKLLSETVKATAKVQGEERQIATCEMFLISKKVNKVYKKSPQNPVLPAEERAPSSDEPCYAMTRLYCGGDPRKHYSNCTSVDVYDNIFSCLIQLLTGLFDSSCSHGESCSTEQDFVISGAQFTLVGRPKKERVRSPIPDRSLCTESMSFPVSPPVCSFELKGPTVKFVQHARAYWEKKAVGATGRKRSVAIRDQDAEVAEAQERETYHGSRGCEHEEGAEKICKYLNYLFESRKNYKDPKDTEMNKKVAKMVAQTLIQALTSSTGCAFLFTYEIGIAFELVDFNEKKQIIVRTSPVFCCGNQKGSLAAMLTLAKYAVSALASKKQGLVAQFAEFVEDSSNGSQPNSRNQENRRDPGARRPRNLPSNDLGQEQAATQNSSSHRRATNPCPRTARNGGLKLAKQKPSYVTDVNMSEDSDMSDITEDHTMSEAEDMLSAILEGHMQVLGSGGSGLVYSAFWQGRKVALKMWNQEEEEGLLELRREVEIYRYIEASAPSLLGSVVPGAIIALDTTNRDGRKRATVALVTEYVGEGLWLDVKGNLWMGEGTSFRLIQLQDKEKICDAALQSIEILHRNKILHGDIELHNLRVEAKARESRGGLGVMWKAYWIDYGKASIRSDFPQLKFDYERKSCASLFDF